MKKQIQVQIQEQETKDSLAEVAADAVKLKEKLSFNHSVRDLGLFLTLFAGATAGRIALQYVPSVEPIIPFVILATVIFGLKEGFVLGSTSYIVSNFFIWGLQGPWTIFQAGAAGLAAFFGLPLRAKKNISFKEYLLPVILATVLFEIIMNVYGSIFGLGLVTGILLLPVYFAFSMPFSITGHNIK